MNPINSYGVAESDVTGMDRHTATEMAFKNGYEKGYADAKKAAEDEILILKQKRVNMFEILDAYERGFAKASKWISVSERLPEGDKVVLCYKEDRGIRFGKLLDATYANGVQAFMDRDRVFAFGATHWMPLPEPPVIEQPKITDQTLNALNRMGDAVHG